MKLQRSFTRFSSFNDFFLIFLGGARRRLRRRRKSGNPASAGSEATATSKQNKANSKVEARVKYDPQLTSSMQWTMKYAPQCAEDIIGNSSVVMNLASWLGQWEARDLRSKRKQAKHFGGNNDDSSECSSDDFISSGSSSGEDSDSDGVDLPNTALLVGANGVGKTATVYALAHEMGFKVMEVNASSARNGRQVLANLREATQSHDVRGGAGVGGGLMPQQNNSQNTKTKKQRQTALILFEDIDLTFDEETDSGFYAAVNSLIASTKRPILLTTSNENFLPMQVGSGKNKVLKTLPQAFHFGPVEPNIAARHLQLLALVEGYSLEATSLVSLCTIHQGNVSQAMLALQCSVTTGVQNLKQDFFDATENDTTGIAKEEKSLDTEVMEGNLKALDSGIVKLMGLDSSQNLSSNLKLTQTPALSSVKQAINLLSNGLKSYGRKVNDESLRNNSLPSLFEWQHRFHLLPENCKVTPYTVDPKPSEAPSSRVKNKSIFLNSAICSADSDEEQPNIHVEDEFENISETSEKVQNNGANLMKKETTSGEKQTENQSTSDNSTLLSNSKKKMTKEEKSIFESLTYSMEFASSYFNPLESENSIETPLTPSVGCNGDTKTIKEGSNKEKDNLNLKSSVPQNLDEAVKQCQRSKTLYLAHEEAMQTASTFSASMASGTAASTAFLDILPTIRAMAKSEDFRSKDQKNSSRKSRRNERFIHYFDTINVCLTEKHLEVLKKPFFSYV